NHAEAGIARHEGGAERADSDDQGEPERGCSHPMAPAQHGNAQRSPAEGAPCRVHSTAKAALSIGATALLESLRNCSVAVELPASRNFPLKVSHLVRAPGGSSTGSCIISLSGSLTSRRATPRSEIEASQILYAPISSRENAGPSNDVPSMVGAAPVIAASGLQAMA